MITALQLVPDDRLKRKLDMDYGLYGRSLDGAQLSLAIMSVQVHCRVRVAEAFRLSNSNVPSDTTLLEAFNSVRIKHLFELMFRVAPVSVHTV